MENKTRIIERKTYWKYYSWIWGISMKKVWNVYKLRNVFITLMILIGANILYLLSIRVFTSLQIMSWNVLAVPLFQIGLWFFVSLFSCIFIATKTNVDTFNGAIEDVENLQNKINELNKKPNIKIETLLSPLSGPGIYKLTVINQSKQKLLNCYVKIEVAEIHSNETGRFLLNPHPSNYLYYKNILWSALPVNGYVNLIHDDPNYLDLLELGREHFRFLFQEDTSLPKGTFEPDNIGKNDQTWLSHEDHQVTLYLYGEYDDGTTFKITKEYALNFMVDDNQNLTFIHENNSDHIGKTCYMKIKEIISYENIEDYFGFKAFLK